MIPLVEIVVRTRVSEEEMELKKGKLLTAADVNVMLSGPTRVLMPNRQPLCIYLPGAISEDLRKASYPALHSLKGVTTDNRGYASASPGRYQRGKRSYGYVSVPSAIVGSFEGNVDGGKSYCRLTAWTGKNWPLYEQTWPLLQRISECFAEYVPDRYAAQMEYVNRTEKDWVVPGTPFSTLTVNNTYPTGVHKDAGDLEEGYSTIAVLRRNISGGALVFPEWRVGVELQDGDLILMDAHQFHGNLSLNKNEPSEIADIYTEGQGELTPSERISLVAYYRTKVSECGSSDEERAKAEAWVENRLARAHVGVGESADQPHPE